MKILFLHGWHSLPGGVKPTFLKDHGHTVINPPLDDDNFAAARLTAQQAFDQHQPDVVVGSSRGGAVALNIVSGSARLVLLCPAWKRWGTVRTAKPGTIILHSRADDVIPFADSEELVFNSRFPSSSLIEVGSDHRLADPKSLAAMLEACESSAPKLIGCDFGAPQTAGAQARKIIALQAVVLGPRHYALRATGFNQRLIGWDEPGKRWPDNRPGWTLPDLRDHLGKDSTVEVATFDFPFSIPFSLLRDLEFARKMQREEAFCTRDEWAEFVAQRLRLSFPHNRPTARMDVVACFSPWRDKRYWVRRACDTAADAQPPLKHVGQNLFSMTLAGAAFLQALQQMGYILVRGTGLSTPARYLCETYPALVARRIGFNGRYKAEPARCLEQAMIFLQSQGIRLDMHDQVHHFCETYRTGPKRNDPDGSDAFLCLLSAISVHAGMAEVISGDAPPEQLHEECGLVVPRTQLLAHLS